MILGCRDESSAVGACEEIAAETGNNDVHFRLLDLASLASVRRFADQFLRRKPPLTFFTHPPPLGGADAYMFYSVFFRPPR